MADEALDNDNSQDIESKIKSAILSRSSYFQDPNQAKYKLNLSLPINFIFFCAIF